MDFFNWWVGSLWGSPLMALFGTGGLLALIGVLGKMSYMLLFSLMALYFMAFGVGFYGILVWLPLFIISVIYFFLQLYKFLQRD